MSHHRRSHAAGSPPPGAGGGGVAASISSPSPGKASPGSDRRVLALVLAFRVVNALLVRTCFNPDEHWQCLEVAHRIAFGYGHLTWEWKRGLRSYLHPLIFAALYKILALLHLDTPWAMVVAPRLLQSVFASFGDLFLFKLSKLIFSEHVAQWTLFSQLVNWFMFFCITRTLSNSLETVLTTAGLYYWFTAIKSSKGSPVVSKQQTTIYQSHSSRKVALLIAALACAVRPTSAITWLYVSLLDFIQIKSKCQFLFLDVIPVGFVLPVLPIMLMFSGYCLAAMSQFKGRSLHRKGRLSRLHVSVVFLIISNVPMALYMSLFHQRGTEDVMFYLSKEAHGGRVKGVLFLMPCHSTPYYSTLHYSLPMRFLDCTPSDNKGTLDESDRFLINPHDFVGENFGNLSSFSHIVLFESEERHARQLLLRNSFQEARRFFHSHFKVDKDLQSSVVVYSQDVS